jgi:hypothetical protein
MIITICSSVEFTPTILEIKKVLEDKGWEVRIPFFTAKILSGDITYEEFMETKKNGNGDTLLRQKENVDFFQRYWDFIKESDAILVLNLTKKGIDGYIGGNTLIEMAFAHICKTKIYLYHPLPERSVAMHYVDELLDFNAVVINEDLSLITPSS